MLRLIGRVATALVVPVSMWAATSVPANAQATDAVYGCGASPIDNESAYVPSSARGHRLWRITTTREGSVAVKCGNGKRNYTYRIRGASIVVVVGETVS